MKYNIICEFCDKDGNEDLNCTDTLDNLKRQGFYNLEVNPVDEAVKDINAQFKERGTRLDPKKFVLGTGAWEGVASCGESLTDTQLEDLLNETTGKDFVDTVRKSNRLKRKKSTLKNTCTCDYTNVQANNKAFNASMGFSADGGSGECCGESLNLSETKKHTCINGNVKDGINAFNRHLGNTSKPVDTSKVANEIGIGVGLAGEGEGSEGNCCGGESLQYTSRQKKLIDSFNSLSEGYQFVIYKDGKKHFTSTCYLSKKDCEIEAEAAQADCYEEDKIANETSVYTFKVFNCSNDQTQLESYNNLTSTDTDFYDMSKKINSFLGENFCYDEFYVTNNSISCEVNGSKNEQAQFTKLVDKFLTESNLSAKLNKTNIRPLNCGLSITYNLNNIHTLKTPRVTTKLIESKMSLREALNKLDIASANKYDLVNVYDSIQDRLDKLDKEKIYELLYGKNAAKQIYDLLEKKYDEVI